MENDTPITFESDIYLQCPLCNETCDMHQIRVDIGFRDEGCGGMITEVCKNSTKTRYSDRYQKSNESVFSKYRSGIKIYFECLMCSKIIVLKINQHKGVTQIFWTNEVIDIPNDDVDCEELKICESCKKKKIDPDDKFCIECKRDITNKLNMLMKLENREKNKKHDITQFFKSNK